MFDVRVFNVPREEVTNYFYWRQLDASRNSIEMMGHANFTTKKLHKKTCNDIQDMLMLQKGINWNNTPTYQKRGSACVKQVYLMDKVTRQEIPEESFSSLVDVSQRLENAVRRTRWVVDKIFLFLKGQKAGITLKG